MNTPPDYTLSFWEDFDDKEWDVIQKGWTQLIRVETEDTAYDLVFFDPVRLAQDIALTFKEIEPFWNEENMVVIEQVDREHITAAVAWLARAEFRTLKPSAK
jgi:hypothetical protein